VAAGGSSWDSEVRRRDEGARQEVVVALPGALAGIAKNEAKQRWSREAYNAYMREYMRKRRVEAV